MGKSFNWAPLAAVAAVCLLSAAAEASSAARALKTGGTEVSIDGVRGSTGAEWVAMRLRTALQTDEDDLSTAPSNVDKMLIKAVRMGNLKKVRKALESGANVDATFGKFKETALQSAAADGDLEVARLLIDAGADVDAASTGRLTALSWAIILSYGDFVTMLLEAGASVSGDFSPPLFFAASAADSSILQELLDAGADVDLKDPLGETALFEVSWANGPYDDGEKVTKVLLDAGADPDARDARGRTPLFAAAERGNRGMAEALLEAGADASIEDKEGKTAASVVCDCREDKKDEWCLEGACGAERTEGELKALLSGPVVA